MRAKEEHRQLIFFLSGFIIGVLYIYFTGDSGGEGTGFLSIQNLMQVKYMDIVYKEYFWYLLKKRLGILFLLVAVALALPGKYLLFGFLMVFGCSMGSMLSVLVMRYGMGGVLVFSGLILPQDIVYVPALFSWVYILSGWNEGLFQRGTFRNRINHGMRRSFLQFFCLIGVTIIGILLECYVNPRVLNFCLKIF